MTETGSIYSLSIKKQRSRHYSYTRMVRRRQSEPLTKEVYIFIGIFHAHDEKFCDEEDVRLFFIAPDGSFAWTWIEDCDENKVFVPEFLNGEKL